MEQISDLLSRSNIEANLEFQNLLNNAATIRGTGKITTKTFPRILDRLKEMVNKSDWKHNSVQLLVPILNIFSFMEEDCGQFNIYPFMANGKLSFIVNQKSTNHKQTVKYIPHMIEPVFMNNLRMHLTDKSFLATFSEAVLQISKIICETPGIAYKDAQRDRVVQFLLAPILHGHTSCHDFVLRALKKLAPEEKLSNLTYFVTEFDKNVDKVSPKQLSKMARFVYKTDAKCFRQILGSLIDKTALIDLDSEATKELTDLINEMHIYDQVYLQNMIECIYKSSSRIQKTERSDFFEPYVNNSLGCVLKNPLWVNEALVGRKLQLYIRLLLHCFADGDKQMLATYKEHASFYAEAGENENAEKMFTKMFTDLIKRSFAEIFYFDNPKALWLEATKMLPGLKGTEKRMDIYSIEDFDDERCYSTIADVITNNILSEMYINKERFY